MERPTAIMSARAYRALSKLPPGRANPRLACIHACSHFSCHSCLRAHVRYSITSCDRKAWPAGVKGTPCNIRLLHCCLSAVASDVAAEWNRLNLHPSTSNRLFFQDHQSTVCANPEHVCPGETAVMLTPLRFVRPPNSQQGLLEAAWVFRAP